MKRGVLASPITDREARDHHTVKARLDDIVSSFFGVPPFFQDHSHTLSTLFFFFPLFRFDLLTTERTPILTVDTRASIAGRFVLVENFRLPSILPPGT
jgi:hypothetical protein